MFNDKVANQKWLDRYSSESYNHIVNVPINPEIIKKSNGAVSHYVKEMLQNDGKVDEYDLFAKAFSEVSGKTIEDLRKLPVEDFDLPEYTDVSHAIQGAIQPSIAFGYKPSMPGIDLSSFFKLDKDEYKMKMASETEQLAGKGEIYPDAVKEAEKKILDLLEKRSDPSFIGPKSKYVKGRFGRKKKVIDSFDYDKEIAQILNVAGEESKIKAKVYTAFKNVKKKVKGDSQKLEDLKLMRDDFQTNANYHPLRKRIIWGGLITLAVGATVAGAYGYIQNSRPSQVSDEEGNYARSKGLSDDIISKIKNADDNNVLDAKEKTMIDFLATIDSYHQHQVVDAVYKDGILSYDEADNMTFLSHLPKDQAATIIESGDADNCDLDGDNINNIAEQTFGMPWDVYNPRYALLVDPLEDTTGAKNMKTFLIEDQKFLPENVISLEYKNATLKNLNNAASELSHKVNKDSMVFIVLNGHGGDEVFCLNDGQGNNQTGKAIISAYDLDNIFDPIKAGKTFITIGACLGQTLLEPLKNGLTPRAVTNTDPAYFVATSKRYEGFGALPSPSSYDKDKNGYNSLGEVVRMAQINLTEKNDTGIPNIVDTDNIADSFYLGDLPSSGERK